MYPATKKIKKIKNQNAKKMVGGGIVILNNLLKVLNLFKLRAENFKEYSKC
jgi:hypothetical protein